MQGGIHMKSKKSRIVTGGIAITIIILFAVCYTVKIINSNNIFKEKTLQMQSAKIEETNASSLKFKPDLTKNNNNIGGEK